MRREIVEALMDDAARRDQEYRVQRAMERFRQRGRAIDKEA